MLCLSLGLYRAGEPSHGVSLPWIHRKGDFLDTARMKDELRISLHRANDIHFSNGRSVRLPTLRQRYGPSPGDRAEAAMGKVLSIIEQRTNAESST